MCGRHMMDRKQARKTGNVRACAFWQTDWQCRVKDWQASLFHQSGAVCPPQERVRKRQAPPTYQSGLAPRAGLVSSAFLSVGREKVKGHS